MTNPLCRLRDVRRSFEVRGQPLEVLRGVDLEVEPGDRIGISGPSGAGKSTLLAILGLIDTDYGGTYEFLGHDVHEQDSERRNAWRLHELGFAFQDLLLVPSLSAEENLALPAIAAGVAEPEARARARALLQAAGVTAGREEHRPSQLSGGERRRVAFARALANRPHLLLVDEPTAELDAASTAGILALLEQAAGEGSAIVAVSHDPRVLDLTRRRYVIHEGRLEDA